MSKTSKEIQGDIFQLIKNSNLNSMITGSIYRAGYRPKDSNLEDVVIIFTTGLADQIETGVVTINIFVPDIDNYISGNKIENGQRCEQLEQAAENWVESISVSTNYKFKLNQTIYTENEPEIKQHFVVIKLGYKFF